MDFLLMRFSENYGSRSWHLCDGYEHDNGQETDASDEIKGCGGSRPSEIPIYLQVLSLMDEQLL